MNRNAVVMAAAITTLAVGIGGGAALAGSQSTPSTALVTVGNASIGTAALPSGLTSGLIGKKGASAQATENMKAACGGGCPGNPAPSYPGYPAPSDPGNPSNPSPTSNPTERPTPPDAPAPDPSTPADSFVARVLQLTNEERAKRGKKPLAAHSCLNDGAQKWSNNMSSSRRMEHQGLGWVRSTCQLTSYAGENIAMGYPTPEAVMRGWLSSPGHYANIMNDNYTHLGVGYNPDGHYWTQDFAR